MGESMPGWQSSWVLCLGTGQHQVVGSFLRRIGSSAAGPRDCGWKMTGVLGGLAGNQMLKEGSILEERKTKEAQ